MGSGQRKLTSYTTILPGTKDKDKATPWHERLGFDSPRLGRQQDGDQTKRELDGRNGDCLSGKASLEGESGVFSKTSSFDEHQSLAASYGGQRIWKTSSTSINNKLTNGPVSASTPVISASHSDILYTMPSPTDDVITPRDDVILSSPSVMLTGTSSNDDGLLDRSASLVDSTGFGHVSSEKWRLVQEVCANKIATLLRRTVELLTDEIEMVVLSPVVHEMMTSRDHAERNTDPMLIRDMLIEMICDHGMETFDRLFKYFDDDDGHVEYLKQFIDTLKSLIIIVSPTPDDDFTECTCNRCTLVDDNDDDLNESGDFNVEIVYVMEEKNLYWKSGDQSSSWSVQQSQSVGSLTKSRVPMLSVHLSNYCLCRSRRLYNLQRVLVDLPCVRDLSLVKNNFEHRQKVWLAEALKDNCTIIKLDLRLSNIGNDALTLISEALRENETLQVLIVASTGLTETGCSSLMQCLIKNRTLSDLDIGFNDIRDAGCRSVAQTLASTNPLRKLRMRDNGITCFGAGLLFQSLARNSRLCYLDVSSNRVGNDSTRHLAEALILNRTLREVNLENCHLSHLGCTSLARTLRANTSLRSLDLSLNPISDLGVEALAEGLKYNQTLETLSINMCEFGNVGFLRLLDVLRHCAALKTVKMCYNRIGVAKSRGFLSRDHSVWPLDGNNVLLETINDAGLEDSEVLKPSMEELFVRVREVLHFNPDLKILLWGNQMDSSQLVEDTVTVEESLAALSATHSYS